MSAWGAVHVVAGFGLLVAAVAAAYRAGTRAGRVAAWAGGACAAATLVAGLLRQRVLEFAYRREVYVASRAAGHWLDRKAHLGFAACCLALAGAFAASDRAAPTRLVRLLWALAAAFAVAALASLAMAQAGAPGASLE